MIWTDELTTKVITLWRAGTGSGEIARSLGLSRNAVVGKLNRMGELGKKPRNTGTVKSARKFTMRQVGGWDMRTTMPWAHRKILRRMEREQGLPFRALECVDGV